MRVRVEQLFDDLSKLGQELPGSNQVCPGECGHNVGDTCECRTPTFFFYYFLLGRVQRLKRVLRGPSVENDCRSLPLSAVGSLCAGPVLVLVTRV